MMPLRATTRAQNRAHRIAAERHHNRDARMARQAEHAGPAPPDDDRHSDGPQDPFSPRIIKRTVVPVLSWRPGRWRITRWPAMVSTSTAGRDAGALSCRRPRPGKKPSVEPEMPLSVTTLVQTAPMCGWVPLACGRDNNRPSAIRIDAHIPQSVECRLLADRGGRRSRRGARRSHTRTAASQTSSSTSGTTLKSRPRAQRPRWARGSMAGSPARPAGPREAS